MDYQNLEKIKILTEQGFKNFESIIDQGICEILYFIEFENGTSIKATHDHKFYSYGEWIKSEEILPGDDLYGKIVKDVYIIESENVYDVFNVEDTHSYISNGVLSHNCNMIYIDEAAIIPNNIAEDFFTAIYPIISAGKNTKVILTSTPLGYNHFWKYWNESIKGTNGFVPIEVKYQEHPERDEAWAEFQKKLLGEIKYNQEVLCVSGDTLITLRNDETGEILNLTIEQAYKLYKCEFN